MSFSFRSLTRGKQITLGVLCAHALLVILMLGNYWIDRPLPRRRPIAVRTFRAPSPQPVAIQSSSLVKPAPKKTTSQPTKAIPKAVPKKVAPVVSPPSDALLQEITKNLESLSTPVPSTKSAIAVPTIQFNTPHEEEKETDFDSIALFLQNALELPEYGEVKVRLTIDTAGHVASLEILETKNEKNEEFLKKRLPELQFPCLNKSASLSVVFKNAL
ncbi:MAG: hypothetical protein KGJ02_00270 [Verrucomicrobiota bacterium]|nr:hypothetical protein [Verrucomicrobiota bacterium]